MHCRYDAIIFLLFYITCFFRLGLVCAFVTNARIEEGVQNLPPRLETAIHDMKIYINNTDNVSNKYYSL